jgi:hypothetical protein
VLLVSEHGCNTTGHPPDCEQRRGGFFDANLSSTWIAKGEAQISLGSQNVEIASLRGAYGVDKIETPTTGSDAVTGVNTAIGTFDNIEPPFGLFGLQDGAVDAGGTQVEGLLQSLKDAGEIESLSWGYTAGASYSAQPSLGSLSLGGYDTLRSDENNLKIPLAENQGRQLVVRLEGIESGSFSLLQEPIDVFIGE